MRSDGAAPGRIEVSPADDPSVVDAGLGRRITAGVVDWLVLAVAMATIHALVEPIGVAGGGWTAFALAELIVVIAPMAVTGRPPGALVARTVVVRSEDRAVPGWDAPPIRVRSPSRSESAS